MARARERVDPESSFLFVAFLDRAWHPRHLEHARENVVTTRKKKKASLHPLPSPPLCAAQGGLASRWIIMLGVQQGSLPHGLLFETVSSLFPRPHSEPATYQLRQSNLKPLLTN